MEIIYRVRDTRLERQVVLKFLLNSVQQGELATQRFLVGHVLHHNRITIIFVPFIIAVSFLADINQGR